MNLTLHLTENCNMDCSYCVRVKHAHDMSEEVLYKAVDLAFSKGSRAGICFFGGEPMLKKAMIMEALDYAKEKSSATGKRFDCKMTTNGTLLDEAFLQRASEADMIIGLSYDGLGQDITRRMADKARSPSTPFLEDKIPMLLRYIPKAVALATIAPDAVGHYAESVRHIHDLGFTQSSFVLAYGPKVTWTDADLEVLRDQLMETADYMADLFAKGDSFILSPICTKVSDYLKGKNSASRCHLGTRQMQVDVRGDLYPCTSFVGDENYYLGNVFDGVDETNLTRIASRSHTPEACRECDLNGRCTNSCGCSNRMNTGDEDQVSPLQCTYERMLIEISDMLGDKMYAADPARFVKMFK